MMKSNPQHHPSSGITRPQPRRSWGRESDCYRHRNSFHPTGFTLIEMLVAFSIMVVMVVIIDRVFVQAGNAIRAGIGTSEITNNYRSLADQIDRDANAMIAPGSGGILVVIHHVLGDWNNDGILNGDLDKDKNNVTLSTPGDGMIGPEETALQTHPDGRTLEGVQVWHSQWGSTRRHIRSDQLLFIANSSGWNPLTGKFLSGGSETFTNDRSSGLARVWFGHVQQTRSDGSIPPSFGLGLTPADTDGGNPNRLGHRFTLGRQALLYTGVTRAAGENMLPRHPGPTWPIGAVLFGGQTDTTEWLWSGNGDEVPGSQTFVTRLDGTGNHWLGQGMVDTTYKPNALALAFSDNRLRVTPTPGGFNINAGQVARMHALFATNISDFIVDFAADLNNDSSIDTLPDAGGGNAYPAGTDSLGRAYPAIPAGAVVWYSSPEFVNFPGSPRGYDSNKPLLHDGSTGISGGGWVANTGGSYATPYNLNGITSPTQYAKHSFIWRHDDTQAWAGAGNLNNSKWPYLLRIRYRLHDKDSRLGSGVDGVVEPGKWFEQIVRVNRP